MDLNGTCMVAASLLRIFGEGNKKHDLDIGVETDVQFAIAMEITVI